MAEAIKVAGRCYCGAIEFEAEVDPEKVVICHCTDCQHLSGAAYRPTVFTLEDAFALRKGRPKIYVKTAESGRQRAQGFCGECGSALYATSVGEGPKVYGLRTGVLDQRDSLIPQKQIWHSSAQSWASDIRSLPAIPGQP